MWITGPALLFEARSANRLRAHALPPQLEAMVEASTCEDRCRRAFANHLPSPANAALDRPIPSKLERRVVAYQKRGDNQAAQRPRVRPIVTPKVLRRRRATRASEAR